MRLVLCRSLWGVEDDPARVADAVRAGAADGYDAVVCPVQPLPDPDAFADALTERGLGYVPQVFTFGRTVDDHLRSLEEGVAKALAFRPSHVICQGGRDGWSHDDALRFFRGALEIEHGAGVPLAHETHRGRILFTPWVTMRVLDEVGALWFNADLSHWVVVGETLRLPGKAIDAIAPRCLHVDARVGHGEGPQVADPRDPVAAEAVAAHEGWWDRIWEARRGAGASELCVTPEIGPPPYQPVDRAGRPLADVAEVTASMAARLRARYG